MLPDGALFASDLNAAISTMHRRGMYAEMLIYLEACHGGSMFDGMLPDNVNVYATTAANADESSYAFYCYPDDVVKGTHIGTCLADEYSTRWMEQSDEVDPCTTSIGKQFDTVVANTSMSHVQEYGQLSIKEKAVGVF